MLSNVTTKGQVTIPAEIRSKFHIFPNDRVDFYVEGEQIIIKPVRTLKQLRGTVLAANSGGIDNERRKAKQRVAKHIAEENA